MKNNEDYVVLRGTTTSMKPCVFDLNDIPVKITKENIALVARKGSELIITDSTVRGSAVHGYFEGDLILDKDLNFVGNVVYKRGFKMLDLKSGEIVPLPDLDSVVIENDLRVNLSSTRHIDVTPIMWIYGETKITFQNIITGGNGKIVVSSNKESKLSTKRFGLFTGIRVDDRSLCFGDTYDGGVVVLHDGDVMVKRLNGEYVKIKEE